MLSNEIQLPNAPLSIAVTEAGRFILVRAVQLSKVIWNNVSSNPIYKVGDSKYDGNQLFRVIIETFIDQIAHLRS